MDSRVKKRLNDMVHGVYRVGVSSAENNQLPYVFVGG